jgi:hypothetical protein
MILGISWGGVVIPLVSGDGRSAGWMASAEASSTSKVNSVKTFRTRVVTMRALTRMKKRRPRRMETGDRVPDEATRDFIVPGISLGSVCDEALICPISGEFLSHGGVDAFVRSFRSQLSTPLVLRNPMLTH